MGKAAKTPHEVKQRTPRVVLDTNVVLVGDTSLVSLLKRHGLRPVYKRPYRVTTDSAHDKPSTQHRTLSTIFFNSAFHNWR